MFGGVNIMKILATDLHGLPRIATDKIELVFFIRVNLCKSV